MTDLPALDIKNLHKTFAQNEVLKGISLQANKGDVISIIGSSGSGKSTFLRCINLLETPTSGEIWVNNELIEMKMTRQGDIRPVSDKQVQRIRSRLAMVFQGFNLWSHMTVLENVIEAPVHVLNIAKDQAIANAEALLKKVGLYERRDYYPGHLSGGQQQRAAIARALAVEPEVLLFDEPTSALDPELVGEVLGVMKDLAQEGRTMLVVTHEMAFARDVSSHVMFLHQGIVEEQGEPEKLFIYPESERLKQFISSIY
ncbi:ATP-binding cassette domain-containing protein [Vibrio sp. V27_P1S3P104]|uniref:ABC transporter ATP-binding protein n=2 Tax=Vibrio TaxID=662 RepID=UPI0013732655|nr:MULTISPECIES: ATP-binding cassette domain-containing protein [unclassified Vibrio]NAW69224.1 ATP-binding cassette domain-containing protein [Vibrio sp. V28_P6S34P95]NAX04373.1 ATP-binding cassette domain-containing protein [Vibrio sp. V30_P3S12P165]NAX35824.1 ATP-binding cassette domain-containing protein [Vibrio sp. V29_P1S30P107]NAX37347.1 ATP-binding cassette domain-containing protein [Vibrio sp. V27_P1S3P104]NAX39179.1 ATP-binding cassette domain-containing protein [Vibrio sp. V26_P1S5P